jgi:DNA polymerase-3 subunit alpha
MLHTYATLHNHTCYSNLKLIDSINTPEESIDYAIELGLLGYAETDHDCISGHIRTLNYFNSKYKDNKNFKLILGNEIYITREGLTEENYKKGEKFYHCILLAKDAEGHHQIRLLSSRAWKRGFMRMIMRTPTYMSDIAEIVGANPGHLICTTACIGGFCGVMYKNFMETQDQNYLVRIDNYVKAMTGIFGDDFYIELQPGRMNDQIAYNKYMIEKYWNTYKFTMATDSHYLKKEDRLIHKTFLQSKDDSGNREIDDFYASTYMMSSAEIWDYVKDYITEDQLNAMFDHTVEIANKCTVYSLDHEQIVPRIKYEWEKRDESKYQLFRKEVREFGDKYPNLLKYLDDNAVEADRYLAHLIAEGYYSDKIKASEKYLARLDNELFHIHGISEKMKQPLSDYFNTMSKIIDIVWSDGDSIVGPGRGSGAGCLINYLIGITQIDPLTQELEMPFWRFMDVSRPGLPDIDFDTEAMKRMKIFNAVQAYFRTINSEVVNVCTMGTLKTKSAIRTAGRGLEMDDTIINYVISLVPTERGQDWSMTDCYYGNGEDRQPIKQFVAQMNMYPKLWTIAKRIEGLITNLSVHASGVLILNGDITDHNSLMQTSRGVLVTCWDLHDSESTGALKYDFLTVQALDKIRTCLNLLLEDRQIEWYGSLKETYNHYLLPANLDYHSEEMWDLMDSGQILECFQYDTMMGSKAVRMMQPTSLRDLAAGNSIMRLMSDEKGGETPLNTFVRYKNNISGWYNEMMANGLSPEEQKILEGYLLPTYGVAGSQELAMRLTMDPHISGFSIAEANKLRKGIAKKKKDVIEATKQLFYEKGKALGTSQAMLDYVWGVQISRQIGYSFSDLHTVAYSTIALQEMNLAYFYPIIYWNCACLTVDANAVNEEDYQYLVDEGMIEITDEEDEKKSAKVNYDKIATAIGKFKDTVKIITPDINKSRLGFVPNVDDSTIMFGLKGLTRIGDDLVANIISHRPYTSVQDFVEKMRDGTKTLISKDKVVNLIKAGCFDKVENKPREEIMKNYISYLVPKKEKLTLQNALEIIRYGLLPEDMDYEKGVYLMNSEIKGTKTDGFYFLDDPDNIQYKWYVKWIGTEPLRINDHWCVKETDWLNIFERVKDKVRAYIKAHEEELINKIYDIEYSTEFNKYAKGDVLQWELDSMNFYYSGHPLTNAEIPFDITDINDLVENESDGVWNINGNIIPKMKLHTICGTVLIADDKKCLVTLSTPTGVIRCKVYKTQYAKYNKDLEDDGGNITSESYFTKGTHLMVTGILRDEIFVPKVYKDTKLPPIVRIILDEHNKFLRAEERK